LARLTKEINIADLARPAEEISIKDQDIEINNNIRNKELEE